MTQKEIIITVLVIALGTALTRFLPFFVFRPDKPTPPFISFLGKFLAPAVFGLLIVYCLKGVTPFSGNHGIPEAAALLVTLALHLFKRQMLLSLLGGTVCYMLLIQLVF